MSLARRRPMARPRRGVGPLVAAARLGEPRVGKPRVGRSRARLIGTALVAALLVSMPVAAAADPSPAPTGPSAAQVQAAKDAVTAHQQQVDAVEASYRQAGDALASVQRSLSAAADVQAAAAEREAQASQDAQAARAAADRADAEAQAATDVLSRMAAAAYEQGTTSTDLLVGMLGSDPQRSLDLAQYVDDAGELLDQQLRAASLSAGVAANARQVADAREQVLHDATAEASRATAQLQSEVDQASAQVAQLGATQDQLVAQLAALEQTSREVQQARLDALAAQAAQAAAQKAAEQAAAQKAAEQAAAQKAAEQAAAQKAAAAQVKANATTPVGAAPPSRPATTVPATTTPAPTPTQSPVNADLAWAQAHPRTVAQQLLPQFGFGADQWSCLDSLWAGESSWNWAASNPYSSAYGIPQSLPGRKMASAGSDWLVNPKTQIIWGLGYIKAVYGSPCNAWTTWQSRSPHWY